MISQPKGAQMNKHLLSPRHGLLKGTMGTALFPHGFRSTFYFSPFSTEVLDAV